MNDDLISRKALLQAMHEIRLNHIQDVEIYIDIVELIRELPTAFDKERVIGELRKREENSIDNQEWNLGGELLDLCIIHEHHGENRAYRHAIEIVKKGGIE